jgi:predicted transposase YbfD/YdcC
VPNESAEKSLHFHLSSIVDPRVERTLDHSLLDILMISVCAILCGAEGFADFERFGNAKIEWLSTFLKLPNGIPSHDTFGRVFAAINPRQFSQCFSNWTKELRKSLKGEIVAIDGKTLRRSHSRSKGKAAIHMVSAWAHENQLVLGQRKVDAKSNEITAIPELLRTLDLEGCIVTIDAMGCQKEITKEIRDAKADYVISLKGNQSNLHMEVEALFDIAQSDDNFATMPHDFLETKEKNHGRHETHRYWITNDTAWLGKHSEWSDLNAIGMVESVRKMEDKITTERRFYICSIEADARKFARAVRSHWSIENSLHWSLDVNFGEDQCRVREGNAAENFAILRHLAINILKADTTLKCGIKAKQKSAGWDHSYLFCLLGI